MQPSIFDKRPPYVRFEERELGIDHEASEKAGRPVPRVVNMACITNTGSKDVHEAIAEDWLTKIRALALKQEYPLEWAQHFRMAYDEWKKGNELPREGTPVKTWPMLTREQANRCHTIGYTTVEDLAEVPDSALGQIGLDGRYLRDLARGWVHEAKDKGVNARAIADANVRIEDLERSNADLRKELQALRSQLESGGKRSRKQSLEDEA